MARILLINPPSPEQMGSPLLGLQYVAVALLQKGCEVRVIDAAVRYSDRDPATNRFYRHYMPRGAEAPKTAKPVSTYSFPK